MLPVSLVLLGIGLLSGIVGFDMLSAHESDDDADQEVPEQDGENGDHASTKESDSVVLVTPDEAADTEAELHLASSGLSFSKADLEALPDLFSSGASDKELVTVSAGEGSTVSVLLPEGDRGSIHAIEADHVEELRDSAVEITQVHGGTNLYYIPEGVIFPAGLIWSESGGTLYCEDPALETEALAAGIKILGRITSGVSVFEKSLEDGRVEIHNGDIGAPQVVSNVPISW